MPTFDPLMLELAFVIVGSGLLAWAAVVAKQPLIVAYILCGVALGPHALALVTNEQLIGQLSDLGVVFLLFLAGVVLHPNRLTHLFRKASVATMLVAAASFVSAGLVAVAFSFTCRDAAVIGLACMFSSTILVVKLLPTTTLHQAHMGSLAIGVLILQDLLAVAILAVMRGASAIESHAWGLPGLLHDRLDLGTLSTLAVLVPAAVLLTAAALVVEQFVLRPMMRRIDHFDEGIYLLAIAWCLLNAAAWRWAGLSEAAGAFVAGVAVARSPASLFISEGLKPLRDFFLVLFFFVVGARLDLSLAQSLLLPAAAITVIVMFIRPYVFGRAFRRLGEPGHLATELGWRLDQLSEFGLLIAFLGEDLGLAGHKAAHCIQFAVILSLIVSSYIVVWRYPTPIGTQRSLHQD